MTTDLNIPTVNTTVETETTKRGPGRPRTKVTLKRVVLLDGVPVGRGRPNKDTLSKRTVVFIPIKDEYDVNVHGTGKKYIRNLSQYKLAIKNVDISKYAKMVGKPVSLLKSELVAG